MTMINSKMKIMVILLIGDAEGEICLMRMMVTMINSNMKIMVILMIGDAEGCVTRKRLRIEALVYNRHKRP